MLTLGKEPRGKKTTIFADAQAALQRITSEVPGSGQRCSRDRTTGLGTRPMGATKSLRPIPMGPKTCRYRRQREGRRVGKDGSTSLAHLKRGITKRKWVEACSWMESRLVLHHAYRPRKRMWPDSTPAKASKAVASRVYQLRTGHALIGPYLKKIGKRASDTCWWCDREVMQSRRHLFKSCKKWKSQ